MEITEASKYSKNLNPGVLAHPYQNYGKTSPNIKNLKPAENLYKRLETDSSQEENKHVSKTSVLIQTEDLLNFQEELAKKDLEIKNLKKILLETQEKLSKNAPKIENQKPEYSKNRGKSDQKNTEKFEDITFVSKKNIHLFGKSESGLGTIDDSIGEFTQYKSTTKNLPFEGRARKGATEKSESFRLDKNSNKTKEPSQELNIINISPAVILKTRSPGSDKIEPAASSGLAHQLHPNTLLKDSFSELEKSFNLISKADNTLSRNSRKSSPSSLNSLNDLEAVLSHTGEQNALNQDTLDLNTQPLFTNQATNTQIPDSLKETFTYKPVLKIIDDKPSIKKSRNSSLPWIEESNFRPPKPKPKNLRSKTQKKQNTAKLPIKAIKSKPLTHAKTRFRASSQKTKPRKLEKLELRKKDILDDIIFDEEQNRESWAKLMNKFRQNPVIISRLLKSQGRPSIQEDFENTKPRKFEKIGQVEYRNSRKMPEIDSINSVIDFRPISVPEITPKPFSQHSKRVQDPDWSTSLLDSYVTQNKKKFNFVGDASLLSSQSIEDCIKKLQRSSDEEELKKAYAKAVNTLGVLKTELMLPAFWVNIPAFCEESLAQALSKCQKLLKARALTIKIIELIHFRESVLLDVVSSRRGRDRFSELEKVNEELLQVLVFWKYMELPFTTFVYLGEDYYAKIHEDNNDLYSIFPSFRGNDLFKGGLNESFNFEL